MSKDRVKDIIEKVKKLSAAPAYKIRLTPQEHTGIFASKLGGLPYWDPAIPYPCNAKGAPLSLLLQINFDTAALDDPRLPKTGMLQIFLLDDDTYGLDFHAPEAQDSFRVVYHKELNRAVTEAAVAALGVPVMPAAESPVLKECAVSFEKMQDAVGMTSFDFEPVFHRAVKQATGEETGESIYDYFTDEEYQKLGNRLMSDGHKLLGYPFFTQGDPRECNEEYEKYYDTLLLQLDSEYSKEKQLTIWGDCGIANFFINSAALKRCDFSRVLYNWDCY